MPINFDSNIYVAGHNGMVGRAIINKLKKAGYKNLIIQDSKKLDLTDQKKVYKFFENNKIDYVFQAAAKVGGILSNQNYPKDFILTNTLIQTNLIDASFNNNVKRFLFIGSSCIYPKACKQPIKEEYFMSGPLETTNRAMATSKINGIEMCRSYNIQHKRATKFISVMPCNLFGPSDNYDSLHSHVLAALIKKIHAAKKNDKKFVEIWGTGKVLREFMFSEDFAEGCLHIMNLNKSSFEKMIFSEKNDFLPIVNIGSGIEISISDLAKKISKIISYDGDLKYNIKYPDGTPRKILNSNKIISTGWNPNKNFEEQLHSTYKNYLEENI